MSIDYRTAKGMLKPGERQCLFDLARRFAHQYGHHVIVNIGVEYGASMVCLHQGCPDADLYGVDIDFKPLAEDIKAELGPKTILIEQDSREYVPEVIAKHELRINLVFIDGMHYKSFVRNDACLSELVVKGGYIAFHDAYRWDCTDQIQPEVYPAIQDWLAEHPEQWEELPQAGTIRSFKRIA